MLSSSRSTKPVRKRCTNGVNVVQSVYIICTPTQIHCQKLRKARDSLSVISYQNGPILLIIY